VYAALPPSAPFEGLLFDDQLTTCGACHAAEREEMTTLGVRQFVSQALRPLPFEKVPAANLVQELAACNSNAEPQRCALLDALLGWGSVTDADFNPQIPTFFR
jgi:hypothetical protein